MYLILKSESVTRLVWFELDSDVPGNKENNVY